LTLTLGPRNVKAQPVYVIKSNAHVNEQNHAAANALNTCKENTTISKPLPGNTLESSGMLNGFYKRMQKTNL